MKLEGKVIVLTGAGSGMGRELALELVRRRVKVALVDFLSRLNPLYAAKLIYKQMGSLLK
jgi:NAD(P)-dependent dehydrogenase (short-subunit alcohol dehydrogenase family)